MPLFVALIVVLVVVSLLATYWQITLTVIVLAGLLYVLPSAIRHVRMTRYFASEEFLKHKEDIANFVAEHNEVADYVSEIREGGSFRLGGSSTGKYAHLASFENTSKHKYRRDRNKADLRSPNVHNCSLQVVRNASADPVRYLMKYFDIKPVETKLEEVESLGNSITRLEDAIGNLREREAAIAQAVDPPEFIRKHYLDRFMEQVGVELSPIEVPYPEYVFEYVSAGGNSSQRASITLNSRTIDALAETMAEKIRYRKSAAGQRALMTARLRTQIKSRDQYTCRYCSVSLAAEPHLLLEVDHVLPLSKGGLSVPANLQTLCWRCNRAKSNKVQGS